MLEVTPDDDILPYLPCLSDEEKNEITACRENHANQQAAFKMLSLLVLKGEEMFGQLLNALYKGKKGQHKQLAKDLESMMENELSEDNECE